jgi:hypothetical protein
LLLRVHCDWVTVATCNECDWVTVATCNDDIINVCDYCEHIVSMISINSE